MRYLLLLCTYLTAASELCKISSITAFDNHQRSDLTVFLTNEDKNIYDREVGRLFSYFFVKQLDFAKPNSIIHHTFIIKSSKLPEVYTIKQHIHLKGCNIEFVDVESDDVEAECDLNHNNMYISYKLVNKPKVDPLIEKEEPELIK